MNEGNSPIDLIPMGDPAQKSILKVIGVGGGGGNAVNHMFREGFHDANLVVCNTDSKALETSPVPVRVQLGPGLGAGDNPAEGRRIAEESLDKVNAMLDKGTEMVFITAGMGGGTGTGAAPVVAREARKKNILTVGIVTIPFWFEGKKKIVKALGGVEAMAKEVDALLVINNERLIDLYSDRSVEASFRIADETLSVAVRSISEIITMHGIVNLDFKDVNMVLRNGGVAIMSTGYSEGEGRVTKAIENALHSPLLNNNDVYNSRRFILCVSYSKESKLMVEEMNEITAFMEKFRDDVQVKWGMKEDNSLGDRIKITILASGFSINQLEGMDEKLSAEEAERQEQEQRMEDLIEQLYGTNRGGKKMRPKPKVFIFETVADLDNDDLVSDVENTATYSRNNDTLNKIRRKVQRPDTAVKMGAMPVLE